LPKNRITHGRIRHPSLPAIAAYRDVGENPDMQPLLAILTPLVWRDSLEVFWPIVVEGILVSVALGLIGCFLVVRGIALLGDALAHSVLPGIVIGFFIAHSLQSPWILVGATVMGIAAAVLIQVVHDHSRVKEDASLGIVFTTLFAIGVVLISRYAGNVHLDTEHVLYGNIENFVLTPSAVWVMGAILAGLLLLLGLFYRQVLVTTFDPALATSLGIPAGVVHYGLMAVLSLTVVASFEAVGAILVVGLLIMPGATARLLTDRMPRMLLIAAGHGIVATIAGYWLSHPAVMDTSAGAAISTAGFGLFLAAWLLAPRQGLIPRMWIRRRLTRQVQLENLVKLMDEMSDVEGASVAERELVEGSRLPVRQVRSVLRDGMSRGWIERNDGRVRLTAAGQERARRLLRAHELWREYLQREVGLEADHVEDAAEWIEHHLNEQDLEKLDKALVK
jgi:manganese/zinc/iron transport system permease protein